MKPATINRTAKEFIDNPKISTRVQIIQNEAKKRFDNSVDQKKESLKEVIERSLKHAQATSAEGKEIGDFKFGGGDVVRAINELNKMDGDHAAQKIEQKNIHSFEDLLKQIK